MWLELITGLLPVVGKILGFIKGLIFKAEKVIPEPKKGTEKMGQVIQWILDWAEEEFNFDVPDKYEDEVVKLLELIVQFVFNQLRVQREI